MSVSDQQPSNIMAEQDSVQLVAEVRAAKQEEDAPRSGCQEGEDLVSPRSAAGIIQSVTLLASQTANSVMESVVSAKESVASVKQTVVQAKDSVLNSEHVATENAMLTNDPSGYEEGAEKTILVHSLVHN